MITIYNVVYTDDDGYACIDSSYIKDVDAVNRLNLLQEELDFLVYDQSKYYIEHSYIDTL